MNQSDDAKQTTPAAANETGTGEEEMEAKTSSDSSAGVTGGADDDAGSLAGEAELPSDGVGKGAGEDCNIESQLKFPC
jgi:hypothetical protein